MAHTEHPRCAGTTARRGRGRCSPAEHPRLRGDNRSTAGPRTGPSGTPPPARGQQPAEQEHHRHVRNTPACAGTTRRFRRRGTRSAEHPRLRGDNYLRSLPSGARTGTPPPARGQPCRRSRDERLLRNTPACAGTTRSGPPALGPRSEHPRLRGDNTLARRAYARRAGTPPPARGQRGDGLVGAEPGRNTPACAGTTTGWRGPRHVLAEHPRLRGDNASSSAPPVTMSGTPPPARGQHGQGSIKTRSPRNTPACAGTTGGGAPAVCGWSEHPRLRGDNSS